jgi:hypothetical protein
VKNARFFVTVVLVLATLGVASACDGFRASKQAQTQKQVQEGDQKLAAMSAVESDLTKRSLFLTDAVVYGRQVSAKTMAEAQNWRRFSKAERGLIKESLAKYLALSNEVLGLDAKRGIYLDRKETFDAKRDAAQMYQKSIEDFEKVNGENYEPKRDGNPQEILRTA